MNENDSPRNAAFATWLGRKLKDHGLSQTEFASQVGVTQGTVSKWLQGRKPQGKYFDLIAAAFNLTYDDVATRVGDRPPNFTVDPSSPEGQFVPLIRKIKWTDRDVRMFKALLKDMVEQDGEDV